MVLTVTQLVEYALYGVRNWQNNILKLKPNSGSTSASVFRIDLFLISFNENRPRQ